jgi:hypothetical protein
MDARPDMPRRDAGPAAHVDARDPGGGHGRAVLAWARRAAPLAAVLAASICFRLPVLLDPLAANSDGAVVGLQARHMLRGEWSPLLWGAPYQGSIDAMIAAGVFAIIGPTGFALALVAVLAHLVVVGLAWDVLRRRTSRWTAALLVAPLVFTPGPVNAMLVNVARSWSTTAAFAAVWLLDGASASRRPTLRHAAGCALAGLAVFFDRFSLVFLPAIAVLAILDLLDGDWRRVWRRRALACGAGAALGFLPAVALRAGAGVTRMTLGRFQENLALLLDSCLPWTLGAKTYLPGFGSDAVAWAPPAAFAWLPLLGLASFIVLLGAAVLALVLPRRLDRPTRRLGLFGVVLTASTVAGFLVSPLPYDTMAARYLAPMIFAIPFAALAAASLAGRWLAPLLLPFVASAAMGGWVGYGTGGWSPSPGTAAVELHRDAMAVRDALRSRGIHHAVANYWLAYRTSFLWEEDPLVVPIDAPQDRHPPSRDAVAAAPAVAFLFHPSAPRAWPGPVEAILRRNGTPFERVEIGRFTVLVAERPRPDER